MKRNAPALFAIVLSTAAIAYRDQGVPVKITFKCEGDVDADISDFVIHPIPGMPSIMGAF